MDDIGKHFCQVAVDLVVEFPVHLAQEEAVDNELVDVDQQFFAYALQKSFKRVLEVVLLAELPSDEHLDQLLDLMVLALEVLGVELGVLRRR